ncbi:hypothetical protein L3Q67_45350 (plasmid) [Saccharothrix sp. AJ9571]|nr:hypothetical protein L3Q67_45350 [Saccharothrix sp. AJ9571]
MTTPATSGVVRVAACGGRCWLCGLPAVSGEKLPGRRHKVRLLCRRHDQLVFGTTPEPPPVSC